MNTLSKKILIPMAAVAVIGAGAFGVSQASAASTTAAGDPQASLVQKLADTFHIDKSKVQAVFDQNHTEKQAAREAEYEQSLTQAVTDGKLTTEQKDAVLTEHKKLQAAMQAAKANTGADRHTAMQQHRQEVKDWAAQHNIAESWLMGPGHMRGGNPPADAPDAPGAPAQ
ncbi:MAG: hypothetical protein JWN01_1273 [Patescibacteria group bacterium]|nr:hypothetical protein [Patescibacteria group bacterium]